MSRFPSIAALSASVLLTGCAVGVRAYPVNKEAQKIGILELTYSMGFGDGPVKIKAGDGAVAEGSYKTFHFSSPPSSFGNLYKEFYENSNYKTESAPGFVQAIDKSGRSFYCEYYVNASRNDGTGVCKTNNGAVFQVLFKNLPGKP
jgi:hypothetical protein